MFIAIVQTCPLFDPAHNSPSTLITKNLDEITSLLSSISPVELIICPEMASTGYNFNSKAEILPFARLSNLTIDWALKLAQSRKCFVQIGFPRSSKGEERLYNTVCIANPNGRDYSLVDKHFLFEQDENWAEPGDAFKLVSLSNPLNCKVRIFVIKGWHRDLHGSKSLPI
jgi:protein N-terminal amidase